MTSVGAAHADNLAMISLPHIYRRRNDHKAMYYTWFSLMHTRVDIAFVSELDEQTLGGIAEDIYRRVDGIERMASCFRDDSELSAINRRAALGPMSLSAEMEHILGMCIRYNRLTDGLFDVTASATRSQKREEAAIQTDSLGISHPGDGTIAFCRRDIYINLSGFLKGYALEQIRPILAAHGIRHALVNMGNSSIMAIGNMHDGHGWPVAFGADNPRTVTLSDQCLTTSGNDTPERRHIIDPRTSQLVTGRRAIAVVNNDATEGEVLSTALFVSTDTPFTGFKPYRIVSDIY